MECYRSGKSEFVMIYGRRRVGKTFLVNETFAKKFTFSYTGAHNFSKKEQLANFAASLAQQFKLPLPPVLTSWQEAFMALRKLLEARPKRTRELIFLDEMPWIDAHKSRFVPAFENFWNGWASLRTDVMLIACGSATAWMVQKLVKNRGGLHNRITRRIYLRPFNLHECEQFLHSRNCRWDRKQIAECFMALGGVPYYLNLIKPQLSMAQNLDRLFFADNAELRGEFTELFDTLFADAHKYAAVVRLLAQSPEGLTRKDLSARLGMQGTGLTTVIDNLVRNDFVTGMAQFGHKVRDVVYRLCDPFLLFYFKFLRGASSKDPAFWTHRLNSPAINSWQGHAFEIVEMLHLQQIKLKLGIAGMATNASTWRNPHTQFDLVIDRADRVVNLCEMKFSNSPFAVTKSYADTLTRRVQTFQTATHTRKAVFTTLITSFGVAPGKYDWAYQSQVTLDDLFIE